MSRRIISHDNIMRIIREAKEFHVRYHGLTTIRLIYGMIAILALIILSVQAAIGVTEISISKTTIDNLAISIIFIGGAVGILSLISMYLIIKMRKIIMITEFQSLLFASALRIETSFCMIVNDKLDVLYIDADGQQLFNRDGSLESYKSLKMDIFLMHANLNENDKQGLLHAIERKESFMVQHDIGCKEDKLNNVKTYLKPLSRPMGFFLLQGYV